LAHSAIQFPLNEKSYAEGLVSLARKDKQLAHVIMQYGDPPFWTREPGFATLVHIILEQQVSLASARAAFDRLLETTDPLTPETFLQLDNLRLKQIGFSRQKAGYVRGLSETISRGKFNLDSLERLDDQSARSELIRLKGIGPWTADIYLLMALRRPDIWPAGDLALVKAFQELYGMSKPLDSETSAKTIKSWKPWRAVAARIMWHYYLSKEL
jgi:DNA-3-methyladenine glycosylase II